MLVYGEEKNEENVEKTFFTQILSLFAFSNRCACMQAKRHISFDYRWKKQRGRFRCDRFTPSFSFSSLFAISSESRIWNFCILVSFSHVDGRLSVVVKRTHNMITLSFVIWLNKYGGIISSGCGEGGELILAERRRR